LWTESAAGVDNTPCQGDGERNAETAWRSKGRIRGSS